MRSIFSVSITLALNFGHLKQRIWDDLPPEKVKLLFIRCFLATTVQVTNLTIVKYFSLIFQGIARNLTPIVTILLSQVMIGESVPCFDISFTLVSLIGVVLIIAGGFQDSEEIEEGPSQVTNVLCLIGALALPFCLSLSNIINRKMKGVHRFAISCYLNPAHLTFTALIIVCTGKVGDTW